MLNRTTALTLALLFLFTLSGLCGLLYESLWAHYLSLLLGHSAMAQTLVLALFMGGMALGAWLVSRLASQLNSPLLWYGLIEAGVGLYALAFHPLFLTLEGVLFDTLLPHFTQPWMVDALKWGLSSLLILPPAILLGTTFPLMSSALVRTAPSQSGRSLSLLYFSNSIGAASGALASAFWLIPTHGLPGTLRVAAVINLLVACGSLLVARFLHTPAPSKRPISEPASRSPHLHLLLFAALFTGFASFGYEIAWIREISLVLGASTQAFEMMLSAFITGLAFGAFWLRRRIGAIRDPLRFAAHVQWLKGALALATLPLYLASFEFMAFMLNSVQRNDGGYLLYNLTSHTIALLVMLPATFMAGMTLPLFTETLLRSGGGEASIGRIYAANTLGSILGILAAVHLLMPLFGLGGLLSIAAALDIAIAIALFAPRIAHLPRLEVPLALGTAMCLIIGMNLLAPLQPERLASGVYRYARSELASSDLVLFHRDGKTATVTLTEDTHGRRSIRTNGKPDASLNFHGESYTPDEITMTQAAILPLMLRPHSRRVANIGFGSGQTTHTLLAYPELERVDTIEIEPLMVEAARLFAPYNSRAYEDSRSHIHIDDAKAYFARQITPYDLIISEPSNPWVSGVASLFTQEFYTQVQRYLVEDGLFVQWFHLYESDFLLVSSVIRALNQTFTDYQVFITDELNVLIIASPNPITRPLDSSVLDYPGMRIDMARVDIHTADDLALRYIGDKQLLAPLFEQFGAPVNSDFYPFIAYQAPKARFLAGTEAGQIATLASTPIPIIEMLSKHNHPLSESASQNQHHALAIKHNLAVRLASQLQGIQTSSSQANETETQLDFSTLQQPCTETMGSQHTQDRLLELAINVSEFLSTKQRISLWETVAQRLCKPEADTTLEHWLALHLSVAQRTAQAMVDHAEILLETDPPKPGSIAQHYLIAAAMLGHLHLGHTDKARQVWHQHLRKNYPRGKIPPLSLLLLVSHTR